jgi:hypothetical protein
MSLCTVVESNACLALDCGVWYALVRRVRVRPEPTEAMSMAERQHLHSSQWNPPRCRRSSGQWVALPRPSLAAHLQVVSVGIGLIHLMKRRLRRRMAAQTAQPPRARRRRKATRKPSQPSAPSRKQGPWAYALRCVSIPTFAKMLNQLQKQLGGTATY